eukprot:309778-Pleurochrysis_carterae.AAC.4
MQVHVQVQAHVDALQCSSSRTQTEQYAMTPARMRGLNPLAWPLRDCVRVRVPPRPLSRRRHARSHP